MYVRMYARAARACARAACERGSAVYINFARACPDFASAYPPITHVHGITRGQDFCLSRVYNTRAHALTTLAERSACALK